MRHGKFILLGGLALAAILGTTQTDVYAARGGHGGGGRGFGGGSRGFAGGRSYGGYGGYNRGYGGYGYGRGYGYSGIGIGLGGFGLGYGLGSRGYGLGYGGYGGYGNYGSGYSYSPSYSSYSSYSPSYNVVPAYGYDQQGYYPDQTYPSVTAAAPVAPATVPSTQQSLYYNPQPTDNCAHIEVLVPATAQVWLGGELTTQTGPDRVFVSPTLEPGKTYTYEVKARWMQEGQPVEQVRKVRVQANQATTCDFSTVAEKQ